MPFFAPDNCQKNSLKELCLEGLAPSAACPGCAGEAERHKGWYVSLQAAPRLQKRWLRYTQGSLAWSGTSGPVACACHRGGEPSDFKTLPAWITMLTGRNNMVLWDGGSAGSMWLEKKFFNYIPCTHSKIVTYCLFLGQTHNNLRFSCLLMMVS